MAETGSTRGTRVRRRKWLAAAAALSVLSAATIAPTGVRAVPLETIVAGPLDSGAYFYGDQWPTFWEMPAEGPIEDLVFSVYATELHRSADGALYVRDYNSIVRIAPDEQSYRRVVGLPSAAQLDDPGVNTSFDSTGEDPTVVPTRLLWEGGRRTATDPLGRLVYADRSALFRIGTDGLIEHLGGTGTPGNSGDGGPATDAEIDPHLLQVDQLGNIWFASEDGSLLRRIGTDGIVESVAGTGTQGDSGDGGPATAAQIRVVDFGVAPEGDVAILTGQYDEIAGYERLRIRVVDASTGSIDSVELTSDLCPAESGAWASQSQHVPRFDGSTVRFVGDADPAAGPAWARCRVDLATGELRAVPLGIDPSDDRRSNIEVADDAAWFIRYDFEAPERSGLVKLTETSVPTVSVGSQSGLERDSVTGSVFVPITLSEPVDEPVTVSFHTVDGTATAGADYLRWGTPAAPRTVTIPAGQIQTQINIPVLPDELVEGDESFFVVLSQVSGGGVGLGEFVGTATIVDADGVSAANPALTVSNLTIVEGDEGRRRAQFQIHLSRAAASVLAVSYSTTDGTAVAGQDYVAKLPGTVTFLPGQLSRTVDVLVESDREPGTVRQFHLNASVLGGPPVEEISMTGVARIVDDD